MPNTSNVTAYYANRTTPTPTQKPTVTPTQTPNDVHPLEVELERASQATQQGRIYDPFPKPYKEGIRLYTERKSSKDLELAKQKISEASKEPGVYRPDNMALMLETIDKEIEEMKARGM